MSIERVSALHHFDARLTVPGDKSISHRALIFGALSEGETRIEGLLNSADVTSTWQCLSQMGVQIQRQGTEVCVQGVGLAGLQAPSSPLDCGNSGTTLRLLMGMLAGQKFSSVLSGDASLSQRPMKRVAQPLSEMGAVIELRAQNYPPVKISPAQLQGIDYALPIASAQLKTSLLLAGLWAEGPVRLQGEIGSRDHTERLLPHFGVNLKTKEGTILLEPKQSLKAAHLRVPGDPSTAAFWLAAAAMIPGGRVEISGVSLNPTRLGFVQVLQRMGAVIAEEITAETPEPLGILRLQQVPLQATRVYAHEIPDLVDEVPLIAILATQAQGRTEVRGAGELRVKESDRLSALAQNLTAMGVKLELFEDGFAIEGPQALFGAKIDPHHDHRIAMAFAIAGLVAEGETEIQNPECVGISYPEFFDILRQLQEGEMKPCAF
ncbi:3-phosphoshikimate 1-carboxyvinyltransferase [bacterium (Candidatus Blackallbacteria) CG17_big_fil_post_rev_8_21_14_2_50_48_46]|uniref:3-phosphoshikimate 1-carboxyvinyltransferase n=1 Tax=bacterium (Candidatus Blackallbacteria) CG17_big_fil_post_rev_8_21_14_2_50_48_46 TaxID=2014261 RepID=A0A2M7G0H1_9BACT|nr:MAG: 3-phosphoshikimate 1-carboxyvinyltransferase [bacterium (Candidatus Blackallbacteria) CG18_big_fil_WC_8_21_14_2_50_49_26]PIW14722.1 MAG: 3-phosphoshikimate 1-carboxyvinyltransferase [bacterium (Candidatus Blackallbacteria) CG17_big_fil_post_rev_8_21_14_2_50_48_46]PIW50824.1 MAG: 3-phosphoshikimate 1-carboxyvinyltransferase [bacterium (Candidatus Blackallbacteria) CG13_big_fil_rev_8_21_14_2_50_49_14]